MEHKLNCFFFLLVIYVRWALHIYCNCECPWQCVSNRLIVWCLHRLRRYRNSMNQRVRTILLRHSVSRVHSKSIYEIFPGAHSPAVSYAAQKWRTIFCYFLSNGSHLINVSSFVSYIIWLVILSVLFQEIKNRNRKIWAQQHAICTIFHHRLAVESEHARTYKQTIAHNFWMDFMHHTVRINGIHLPSVTFVAHQPHSNGIGLPICYSY